jgi:hypothetical protein
MVLYKPTTAADAERIRPLIEARSARDRVLSMKSTAQGRKAVRAAKKGAARVANRKAAKASQVHRAK